MSDVTLLTNQIAGLKADHVAELERHKQRNIEISNLLAQLGEQLETAMEGLPVATRSLAEHVIRIRGAVSESAAGAFQAACDDLAARAPILRQGYIGAKRYEGLHQRTDGPYGTAPKHGKIVFAVELQPEVRERDYLKSEEMEAAIRWLYTERKLVEAAGGTVR
jgi:hypothetical protein